MRSNPTPPQGKGAPQGKNGAGEGQASWADLWAQGEKRRVRVDTTGIRSCKKCGRSDVKVYRHHKGFDSFVGQFNKAILFAYYKYKDCVELCFDHHCEIHYIYEPYTEKWFNHTPQGARAFRAKLITICDEWLSGKIRSPTIPRAYYRQFLRSLKEWEKDRGKRETG